MPIHYITCSCLLFMHYRMRIVLPTCKMKIDSSQASLFERCDMSAISHSLLVTILLFHLVFLIVIIDVQFFDNAFVSSALMNEDN